jgi:putative DNA primase/helicase
VRFLTSSETSDGHSLDEGVVKRVTGQSPVTARHIRSKPITLLPEFKLWFQSNYEPVIKGQDIGIWRRLKKIPWNYPKFAEKPVVYYDESLERDFIGEWEITHKLFHWHDQ